ncbi:class I SAM-dependent methyltransferase [Polaribacter vadi]|uniref:class I SAM-dependent methyltransferase n=1 Tax=Polaribacter TaxID=52959 RepID=UPI001C0853D8|nr:MULTISPECIES: class I SAM-dependent methyltransferase [Polaribacter]MBU3010969.1 class I SAM-dependent methyltransferase [Polaribacter vadi]MDO6740782.1 class I SAM-dependent methyltransferase [Polaribacter sp. 1_MG-2023]
MRIITLDDFIDTYFKIHQRGSKFFLSKFTFNEENRTKSAFSNTQSQSSYFWSIPKVNKRWNKLITGNENTNYQNFLVTDFLKDKKNLKLLSLGSGLCNKEIYLAEHNDIFKEVICVDIAENLLNQARIKANSKNLKNIKFFAKNIDSFEFKENDFDIILFNSSLHHFKDVENLLSSKIKHSLKPKGYLIINEFVGANRHQFSSEQIKAINKGIKIIPKKFRTRFRSKLYKNKYRGVGLLRMILADPSECIDSENIIPAIHKNFKIIIEKPYGGNLLMSVLRDISHHFYELNDEKEMILNNLFLLEDDYLKKNKSDFIFGIYENY